MTRPAWIGTIFLVSVTLGPTLSWAGQTTTETLTEAQITEVPLFEVDPDWPTIPNDWILGLVASVSVDDRDHVWVLHRP